MILGVTAAFLGIPSHLHAQGSETTPSGGPSTQNSRGGLEEVTVTARKMEESLQDVPLTVTAFSSEALKTIAPKTLFDMTVLTPSLNYQEISPGRGGSRIQMRGISGGNTGQSRASVFLDGVYLSGSVNNIPFQLLERFEAMPGPQSALFGRSTFAGAVSYITRDPGMEFSGFVDTNLGSLNEEEVYGWLGGPLTDRIRGSVYGWYQAYDPEWIGVEGERMSSTLTHAGGGKLIFDATDNLSVEWANYYSKDWDGHSISVWLDPTTRVAGNPIYSSFLRGDGRTALWHTGEMPNLRFDARNASPGINPNATEPRHRRTNARSILQVDYSMGDYSLAFTGGYLYEEYIPGQLGSATNLLTLMSPIGNPTRGLGETENTTDHISAQLTFDSPQDRAFRYRVGVFHEELDTINEGFTYALNTCLTLCTLDILGQFRVNTTRNLVDNSNLTRDRSVFGSVSYDLSDSITVTLDARYQEEYVRSKNAINNLDIDGTWTAVLPRLNLQYRASDSLQFYAVYSVGNNPGVFNTTQFLGSPGSNTSLSQQQAEQEKLFNYELGFKSRSSDGRLEINAAIFHQVWDDMQFPQVYQNNAGQTFTIVENRGSARIDGVQVEAQWIPVQDLRLRGTFFYNNGEYRNYCSGNFALLMLRSDLPAPNNCLFVNGKQLENVPARTQSLSGDYKRPLTGDWVWFARASYQYQSRMWNEEWNSSWSQSLTTYTGGLGVRNGSLSAELYCRNCSDEAGPGRIGRSTDLRYGPLRQDNFALGWLLRRPRQYGVNVSYAF
jgi:iron complex outermembrane recepter protein